ncbi:hypothetical protein ABB37_00484 [Leptomonas pyrrhocoris]|uniref:Heat shock factor binding protein 1 n=1 Tax=Leptomonas pyrrhocoris TaxID=157538 RepID=A0A0M9GAI5_LEPPY|nr:hypothetical protein ABB37_00484 [Leptomonas pyrrhocoris]XP_015664692.1 hypothetical protein ABB37_00484 [Leptomonas pyrrhocoris]KPA86252.1 hypothetical protein ABB37_00484 [Leptomonas pyrrhocoris]KPA86253.1 hypothetical protein ABB37_00484 [Leptomonas pyrrhocoris]|eukprot:XP_015664691.1 hypothetical protein ABB37_00484 [Leptomonas pyrrhocoris]
MPPKASPARAKGPEQKASSPVGRAPAAQSGNAVPSAVPQGGTQELTSYVQGLLQQMQSRFEEMSNNIISRIDEMGARIDDLERSIDELMQQSGVEDGDTPGAKPKK